MTIETVSENKCFGGIQGVYSHASRETGTPMRFSLFMPPTGLDGPPPVLYWLSGLTCTEENFTAKAGAQRWAPALAVKFSSVQVRPESQYSTGGGPSNPVGGMKREKRIGVPVSRLAWE